MKLIRLKSNNNNLTFQGKLDSNIILKPFSKIGLKNLSFQKQEIPIQIVETQNALVQFTMGNLPYTLTLSSSTYNKGNIEALMTDLEDKLNEQMTLVNGLMIGGAWRCTIDYTSYKVEIAYTQNPMIDIVSEKISGYAMIGMDDANPDIITKSDEMSALPDSAIGVTQVGSKNYEVFSSRPRIDPDDAGSNIPGALGGCGFVRCQIKTISNAGGGFFLGLSKFKLSGFNGSFLMTRFEYAIRAENTQTGFSYIHPGINTPITITNAPAVNDLLEISLSEGLMNITIYTDTTPAGVTIFSSLNQDEGDILYPYLVFYSATGNSVSNFEFTPLNKIITTATMTMTDHNNLDYSGSVDPPIQELFDREISLTFTGGLNNILGFRQPFEQFYGKEVIFYSDDMIIFIDQTECYFVLLENYSLLSYDMTHKKRGQRSILDVIQNIRNKTDEDVYYNSDNPLLIDLNNANPVMLKNLNIQILDTDENRPLSIGFSNMAIVLD